MNKRISKKINKNPSRYKGYQITKAETMLRRRAKRAPTK